jgi:two-component system response regulator RegX3
MQARIMIVEDNVEMSRLMSLYLERDGMETREFETAEAALAALPSSAFDLIVIDINLPGMDGLEFLAAARKITTKPVLIVSARNSDEDLIAGLGLGADEYMTKPFSPKVFVARVRALLRRARGVPDPPSSDRLELGPFVLDRSTFELYKKGELIHLSVKEFAVLRCLMENSGVPRTPEEIYERVWKREYGDLTAVGVYIQRIRKKIEENPTNPVYVETVFGRGYRFVLPEKNP